jgi:hypothetical protein
MIHLTEANTETIPTAQVRFPIFNILVIQTELSRTKSKHSYSLIKVGKAKIMEKRKILSSPKHVTNITKNQTNSLSNSSTPVNKTHSANHKGRSFASRENDNQVCVFKTYNRSKLLQQSTVDESSGKGKRIHI